MLTQKPIKSKYEPKIVAIGGGTGLSNLLRGIKKYTQYVTAIVTVTDDGGSSGQLRRELGVLPPGDIRNCLVALSEEENLMAKLFQYRFPAAGSLSGHSFGNIFLTAMSALTGGFDKAIARSSEVLAVRGKVLPATLTSVTLEAHLANGKIIEGESEISRSTPRVKKLKIVPASPPAAPQVIEAIRESDCIIIGPGSLYTSVIANLLVGGVASIMKKTRVPKIYICNIMTQTNETSNYTLNDHLTAIGNHIGKNVIDYAIVNTGKIPKKVLKRYSRENSYPVVFDKRSASETKIISGNFVSHLEYAHHDPEKLAAVIMDIIKNNK